MQFIPATWRAYGLGGDINDPHDAILGAANYLHVNGAPHHERQALFHYNPSRRYVSAISRYTRRIRDDWRAFYAYYAWQVYVGDRRLTEPR
jgi:membrane-bound lytic murein transglycosylase B